MDAILEPDYHYGVLRGYLVGHGAPEEILASAATLHAASRQVTLGTRTEIRKVESTSGNEPEPINELAPDGDDASSVEPAVEDKTDEAKIEAFLNARAATEREADGCGGASQKKRRAWSPEARAAARERMRAMHASGSIRRRGAEVEVEDEVEPRDAPRPVIVKQGKVPSPDTEASARGPDEEPEDRDALPITTVPISSPSIRWKPEPLSDEDWPDIRDMINAGSSREKIAGDYDVPVDTLEAFVYAKLDRTGVLSGPLAPGK